MDQPDIPNRWVRPETELIARTVMLECESRRDYEGAALAAITLSDLTYEWSHIAAESFDRQALVYATLHQASTLVWIAENR